MSALSMFKRLLAGSIALAAVMAAPSMASTVVSVTQTSYDYLNRPVCTVTRMNPAAFGSAPADACALGTPSTTFGNDRITKSVYDNAGHVVQVIQAYGTSDQRVYSTFSYGANGELIDSIDARGNRSHNVYDGFNRLVTFNYPSTTVAASYNPATQATALSTANAYSTTDYEAYGYNANNNRVTWRRRDGVIVYDCYDNLGRTIRENVGSSSCTTSGAATDVFTNYDGLGRIDAKRFSSTSNTTGVFYAYDGLGRVSATTDFNGRTIAYAYNQASSKTRLTYPDGAFVDYGSGNSGYDKRDALERVGIAKYSDATALFQMVYNSLGQTTNLNRGTSSAGGSTAFTQDGLGRLTAMTNNTDGSATTNDITWGFSYSPASQITSWSASNAVFDYKEYTSSTVNQTYDGLNRDAGIAAISGGYDLRGNLTKEGATNAYGRTGRVFTYDTFNRLLTVADNAAPTSPIVTLTYDPEGRLAKFTDSASAVTTLLYDGTALIGEYAGSSTSIAERYVHGPGTDQPLVWFHGSGATDRRYIYGNYQGSVIAYTNASGVVQETYQYGAYGEPEINKANPASTNPWSASSSRFRYTGQTNLFAGTGVRLYYYKARVYDPIYGHFLQTDPIGSKDDLDLYAYVGGDPVNKADPTGNCPQCLEEGGEILEEVVEEVGESPVGEALAEEAGAAFEAVENALGIETETASTTSNAPSLANVPLAGQSQAAQVTQQVYRGSTLARNMANSGNAVIKGEEEAHHIVAQRAAAAQPARDALQKVGIGINDAANGARAQIAQHATTHTGDYYQKVNGMIMQAASNGAEAVHGALNVIRSWFQ